MNETEIMKQIEEHQLRNQVLVKQLQDHGVNIREKRVIECHFWIWDDAKLRGLESELRMRGFRILRSGLSQDRSDPNLRNLEAAITQSVDLTIRREFTDELVRLSAQFSAIYDGWGTSI
jgi:regulator of RNase E activity RraB